MSKMSQLHADTAHDRADQAERDLTEMRGMLTQVIGELRTALVEATDAGRRDGDHLENTLRQMAHYRFAADVRAIAKHFEPVATTPAPEPAQ